jgi:type IV secretion system protein VirB6
MGFFQTFWSWLNTQLESYIGIHTALFATALEPVIVSLAVVYVMIWGFLQMTGRIEEPLLEGLRRIGLLALVLGAALRLWLYNQLIVDTFYHAPAQLAAAVIGASDPVATIDAIWERGGAVGQQFWTRGAGWGLGFDIAGAAVYGIVGLLCVYAMFLIALASIACAVLLAAGPLFIAMLLFDSTRRFFAAWISQLVHYALIDILTVLMASLLLGVVESYAAQTLARGAQLQTVDALDLLLITLLVFLLLRQVMPIASALAGALSLSSLGTMSGSLVRAALLARSVARHWGSGSKLVISNDKREPAAGSAQTHVAGVGTRTITWRDP